MISILIVEDEEAIANLLNLSLKQMSYNTVIAMDGEQALEWIHKKISI